jgi:hypothetical protein
MAISVTVTLKGQEPTEVDLPDEDTLFEDIIEGLASLWDVPPEEYVLLRGTEVFQGKTKISEAGLNQDDILVLIKRQEISTAAKEPAVAHVSDEISYILQWLYDNPGLNPNTMKVVEDNKKSPRVIVFQDSADDKKYRVTLNSKGKVKEYKPIKN